MKKLTWTLVLPITFISYFLIDKWWYVDIIDGPDNIVYGFPLIDRAPSLASSMEIYYFLTETIINISVQFVFWLITVYCINRFVIKINIPGFVSVIYWSFFMIFMCLFIWISIEFKSTFFLRRNFDVKVNAAGYKMVWQNDPVVDYYFYHPKK